MGTSAPNFDVGVELGNYVIDRKIAEGGVGIVLAATHRELQQRVAIKRLRPEVLKKGSLVERFRREAKLAASLTSEHVVRVIDVGTTKDAGPFMVMEYLEGEDLGDVLARGPIPVALAVDYVMQACDALAEAHAKGIVHRDVKPENLFISRRPNRRPILKVLDFGLSKADSGGTPGRLPRMTEAGERFGTPIYMAPEQIKSTRDVDGRADIWALGVVLFELITGDLPFEGENISELTANIINGDATLLSARYPDPPVGLEEIIARCLVKDPARRVATIEEVLGSLRCIDLTSFENHTALVPEGMNSFPSPMYSLASKLEPLPSAPRVPASAQVSAAQASASKAAVSLPSRAPLRSVMLSSSALMTDVGLSKVPSDTGFGVTSEVTREPTAMQQLTEGDAKPSRLRAVGIGVVGFFATLAILVLASPGDDKPALRTARPNTMTVLEAKLARTMLTKGVVKTTAEHVPHAEPSASVSSAPSSTPPPSASAPAAPAPAAPAAAPAANTTSPTTATPSGQKPSQSDYSEFGGRR